MITNLPKKSVILVEENIGNTKKYVIKKIIKNMIKNNKCMYIRYKDDNILNKEYIQYIDNNTMKFIISKSLHEHITNENCKEYSLLVIEDFPYFIIDKKIKEIMELLDLFIKLSRDCNCIILLLSTTNIFDKKIDNIIISMVDGYIQVINKFEEEKIKRYIVIPKLNDEIFDKPIPFVINNGEVLFDTRERIG